jgi:hypothetical protein
VNGRAREWSCIRTSTAFGITPYCPSHWAAVNGDPVRAAAAVSGGIHAP